MEKEKVKRLGRNWPKIYSDDTESIANINENFLDAQDARREIDKIGSKKYKELTSAMWELATNALIHCTKGQPLCPEIAQWLAQTASEIASGQIPEEIAMGQKIGKPSDTPDISDAKNGAALYFQAVKSGLIKNDNPVKTLAEIFDCDRQTIRDWIKKSPSHLWEKFWPNHPNETREKNLMRRLREDSRVIKNKSNTHGANRLRAKKQNG